MNVLFNAVCALLYASAEAVIEFGPLDSTVVIESLSKKYQNLTSDDVKATDHAIAALEYMRRFMGSGIDQVPPMDPYRRYSMEPVVFDKLNSKLRGTVNLSNLKARGAKHYTLNELEVRLSTLRVDFDVAVPTVVADVDFSTVNFVYDNIFKFNASGHLQITLHNLHSVGAFSAIKKTLIGNGEVFMVNAMAVNQTVTIVEVKVNDMVGDIPEIATKEIAHAAASSVTKTSMKQMNEILLRVTPEQILSILLR